MRIIRLSRTEIGINGIEMTRTSNQVKFKRKKGRRKIKIIEDGIMKGIEGRWD